MHMMSNYIYMQMQGAQDEIERSYFLKHVSVKLCLSCVPGQTGRGNKSAGVEAEVRFAEMILMVQDTGEEFPVTRRPQPQDTD